MERSTANVYIFMITTLLLWLGLSAVEILGYLREVDRATLELGAAICLIRCWIWVEVRA
ncbi:hypothetical protein ACFL27_20320 [candidate division CSSED10-310 bacterium]|uniref:Uncharacterized protein n=1 Tax=candidate division CSSED10-310 bacterium TaxID=2855610 RepID=A0ABV6Z269_UNCC1